MIRIAITQECFCRHLRALSEGENGRPEPPTNRSGQRTLKREGWDVDSGNNSSPSVDVKRPAIQPEARFPQLSCAGDAIRSEKPRLFITAGGFDSQRAHSGRWRPFRASLSAVANRRWRASYRVSSLRRRPRSSSKFAPAALGAQADLAALNLCASCRPRFRAFPGEGIGGSYTASPSNTALHRSRMLAERAFGQLASV